MEKLYITKFIKTAAAAVLAFAISLAVSCTASAEVEIADTLTIAGAGGDMGFLTNATAAVFISIPTTGQLLWINVENMSQEYIDLNGGSSHPLGVAVYNSATTPKVFVAGTSDMVVYAYDVNSGTVDTISVGGNPYAVAVNSTTGMLYVTNTTNNYVYVYNANTYAQEKVLTTSGISYPSAVAVNETTNKFYVTSKSTGEVYVFNGATNTYSKKVAIYTNPIRLTVNQEDNEIYVVHSGGIVGVIDGSTDVSDGYINLGSMITDAAYHPNSKNLYVTMNVATYKEMHIFEMTDRTEVDSSPVTISGGPQRVAVYAPDLTHGGPWTIVTANADGTMNALTDTDTYPPRFDGLASATDTASAVTPSVTLHWEEAVDVTTPITYNIYGSPVPPGTMDWDTVIYSTSAYGDVVFSTPSMEYGKTYIFGVRAVDDAASSNSDTNTVYKEVKITDGAAPVGGEITGATDTGTGGSVHITWALATDTSSPITYNIYYNTTGEFNWGAPNKTTTGELATDVTSLTNNTEYYFAVRAKDTAGLTNTNTTYATATPTDAIAPTFAGLQTAANDSTGGTVQLSWNAATDPSLPITYRIYYNTGAAIATWTPVTFVQSPSVSTTITGLTNNTQYAFAVRAEDKYGNIDANVITRTATPTDAIPPSFNGVNYCHDPGTGDALVVGWSQAYDKSTPITYQIFRATATDSFNFGTINYTAIDASRATATSLVMGTEYFFVARAVDAAGNVGGDDIYYPDPESTNYVACIPTDGVNPVFSGIAFATPTATSGEISLGWNEATDSSPPITYNVYMSTSAITSYTTPSYQVIGATSTTITGLTDGTKYYFAVRAMDVGKRTDSNTVQLSAIPNDGVPPVFGGIQTLTDTQTYGSLTASWAAATDPATPITYNIYVSTTAGVSKFSSAPYKTTQATTTEITGLTNNVRYYVGVRAVDAGGVISANTEELFATTTDQTAPAFGGITWALDMQKGGEVKLNWDSVTDPSTPVSYLIYYATGAAAINYSTPQYTVVVHPYTITGLVTGTTYKFSVRARDNASPPNTDTNTVVAIVTPTDSVPPTFSGIDDAVETGTTGEAKLTWLAASDPSPPITYNIYYATTSNSNTIIAGGIKATATGTEATVSGLTINNSYYFIVRPQDVYGNENTNTVIASLPIIDHAPPVFTGLGAATDLKTSGSVALSWSAATDQTPPIWYNIYYTSGATSTLYSTVKTSTMGTSLTITGLTNDTRYAFAVRARDSSYYQNLDDNDVILFATPTDQTKPTWSGATSMANSTKGNELTVTWSAATDSSTPIYYNIYLATTSHGQDFSSPTYSVTATYTYHITGLTNGTTYYAIVTARDSSYYKNETSTSTTELSATPSDTSAPTFGGASTVSLYSEDGKVLLEWGNAYDRSPPIYYNVYQRFTGSYPATPTYTLTATNSLIVSGLKDNQYVFFRVRAKDSADSPNEDTNTIEKSIRFDDLVGPAEPTNITAVAGDTSPTEGDEYITISWTPPTLNIDDSALVDLNGYRILRGTYAGAYDDLGTAGATATSYVDDTVIAGIRYYYVVVAKDDASPANESPLSAEVSAIALNADDAIPQPPDNFRAVGSDGQVLLSWVRPELNEDDTPITDLQGYLIYRSETQGANYGLLTQNILAPETLQYTDTNVTNDHTYYYVITSLDSSTPANESELSTEASATPGVAPDYPPNPPSNLSVITSSTSNFLSWSAPTKNTDGSSISDLAGYNVYRSQDCGTSGETKLNSSLVTAPTYTDSPITAGIQYSYYVTAVDTAGNESASSSAAVSTYGTKGVSGTILYRDMSTKDSNGYALVGLACRQMQLVNSAGDVVASGYTSNNGAFKIVYETASSSDVYSIRLVVNHGDGFPYTFMLNNTGYLTVLTSVTISTGFTTLKSIYPVGKGPAVGNVNCDGDINLTDILSMKSSYGSTSTDDNYKVNADINGDGRVNLNDILTMKGYYGLKADVITPSPCQ